MSIEAAEVIAGFRLVALDLNKPLPSNREMYAEQLELSARLIRKNSLASAAWRIADAAGWLVDKINKSGEEVTGVHCRTGMGALLVPNKPSESFKPVSVRTALYRHFDADDRLLYVGISLSAVSRLKQHSYSAHWYSRIARVAVEWLPSREAALLAEAKAIKSEGPAHNIALVATC